MNVRVEEFEDKSEKNADGFYDYCYKGKYFFFEDANVKVRVRMYSDSPNEASFLSLNDKPFDAESVLHPLLKQVESYLRELGFTEFKILFGESGAYEPFC